MGKKPNMYEKSTEERFLSDAILDLRRGLITYVYKDYILDELKKIFNDLDIARNEFYWTVRNKEKQILQPITGRPRKLEVR
jgi:hypothetical protein